MNRSRSSHPRRWFIYSLCALFIFLCLAIVLAAILVLRRGNLPRSGLITGSSMEPILRGPRFFWTCSNCSESQEFALDTCKSNQPFRCRFCEEMDMDSAFYFEDIESLSKRSRPGAEVQFVSLRTVRKTRANEIANGRADTSGLHRGDVVVFQERPGAKREVKRIVGFALERVAIEGGDVFVNEERWCKSLEQSLRQSVLLNAWERSSPNSLVVRSFSPNGSWIGQIEFQGVLSPSGSIDDSVDYPRSISFGYRSPRLIDNSLSMNAHDSHLRVPVHDFGFAFQLSRPDQTWKIKCVMSPPFSQLEVTLDLVGNKLTVATDQRTSDIELLHREDQSLWIAIVMVDGHLVVGSQDEEWFRTKFSSGNDVLDHAHDHVQAPICIEIISGKLELDQLLVFRDVFYRGQGDSITQTWESGERVVVLGDNVSASSDSRDRWPDGLSPSSIKGVVLQTESPIEVLLRQR